MRVLVTGITGFVGSHFADYALERGATVIGSSRKSSKTENIEHIRDRVTLVDCDLLDMDATRHLIEVARPDRVIHLAAQSSVKRSLNEPFETFKTNTVAQMNVLEAVRAQRPATRCLVIGSSEEYGVVSEDEQPITETNPLRPASPYAWSKAAQDLMGHQYFKIHGMHIVRSRAFNHDGPRRGESFVISELARQILRIKNGSPDRKIVVGDLKIRRDFTDVKDIVRGYWQLLEDGKPGEVYNLCSGRARVLQDVLDFLLDAAKVEAVDVSVDPDKLRPEDPPVLRGDATKALNAVGWKPEIPFEQTLRDILEYWRGRV